MRPTRRDQDQLLWRNRTTCPVSLQGRLRAEVTGPQSRWSKLSYHTLTLGDNPCDLVTSLHQYAIG
jgi:hypothetical protein